MKKNITEILKEYLDYYSNEIDRQNKLIEYLKKNDDNQITDWNNFNGHIVASGIIYSNKTSKFLVMYHKDMKRYIYSGGHIDKEDNNPLETAIREIKEETGIDNLKLVKVTDNELLPFDIDTQVINYNERLKLPQHIHFDFRYLFEVDDILNIEIDNEEMSDYKWIKKDKFYDEFKEMSNKLEAILKNR